MAHFFDAADLLGMNATAAPQSARSAAPRYRDMLSMAHVTPSAVRAQASGGHNGPQAEDRHRLSRRR